MRYLSADYIDTFIGDHIIVYSDTEPNASPKFKIDEITANTYIGLQLDDPTSTHPNIDKIGSAMIFLDYRNIWIYVDHSIRLANVVPRNLSATSRHKQMMQNLMQI